MTRTGTSKDKLHCVVCNIEGTRAPTTKIRFKKADKVPNYLSSVYVKPLLTELFPKGVSGRPFQYMLARSFILPFCTECESEVRGVLSAKTEIENLRKLIDASLSCIRIKVEEQSQKDEYPDEDYKILGQYFLGTQKPPGRKSKEGSTQAVAAEKLTPCDTVLPTKSSVAKRQVSEVQPTATPSDTRDETESSPQRLTRSRKVNKPVRFRETVAGKTPTSPVKAGNQVASAETIDPEQVDLNDHSDLIAFTVNVEPSDVIDDPDWIEEDNAKSSKKSPQKSSKDLPQKSSKEPPQKSNKEPPQNKTGKRGRPKRAKPPKVIKQVQAPKVYSEEISPGVYKWKDHVYRSRPDGKWECDMCHVVLRTRPICISHIAHAHLGKGKGVFECEICGKVYDRRTTLMIHKETHSKKTMMCQWCGKLFNQKNNFRTHILTHEGKLDFVCDWEGCGKRFLLAKQLKVHRMRHENIRPYLCEHCPKRYTLQYALNLHLRTHTGERPFACNFCASRFFIKSRLTRHYNNVHGIPSDALEGRDAVPADNVPVANVLMEIR